jgi:hypothetical protein
MAQRRMFSSQIVTSDAFLEMPLTSQALYFHLGMSADDDGFVSPRKVLRMSGAGEDDLKILLVKGFVIPFESGIIVITHWKQNNYLRNDRYTPTIYKDERERLSCVQSVYRLDTIGIPSGNQRDTQEGRKEVRKKEIIHEKNQDQLSPQRMDAYFAKGREILRAHREGKEPDKGTA